MNRNGELAQERAEQSFSIILDSDGELQGVVFCVLCGNPNHADQEVCSDCGTALLKSISESQEAVFCFFCGNPNDDDDETCRTCGEPLDERLVERRLLMARISTYISHSPSRQRSQMAVEQSARLASRSEFESGTSLETKAFLVFYGFFLGLIPVVLGLIAHLLKWL